MQSVAALVVLLLVARPAAASNHLIAIDEVLGSWQGDDEVQFVSLRMLAAGQQFLSNGGGRGGSDLLFDDASGSAATRVVFTFTHDLTNGLQGARILIATAKLTALTGIEPDFVLPPGMLSARNGRVCYRVNPPQAEGQTTGVIDCVAYGKFTGNNGPYGPPTPITPDDRSIQRVQLTYRNVDDWTGVLRPTPTNNAGAGAMLDTLCGDGLVSQGEECDGTMLAGKTCASLGFASGDLACAQCHVDASKCSFCGNGAINGREECDGIDFGGRTCGALGFTGGDLSCTATCRLSTRNCDPVFFVPGGGPPGPECLAEWRVTNATNRPDASGKAPVRQRCKDGDLGCDADVTAGTCTFTLAICFDRDDVRLAVGGKACRRTSVETWTLQKPPAGDATSALVSAVAAVATSTTAGNVVTFMPPLDATERCTDPVAIVVPRRGGRSGTLLLKARTTAAGGKPRDVDMLKLVCTP